MADMEKILEQLSQLTILEVADLSKKLEEKWGVSAAVAVAPVVDSQGGAEKAEEQSTFDVLLTEAGSQKIAVIKEVRSATQLGLKEAKDLVESAPKAVKSGISKEDAETLKKALESVGAKVEIK